MRSTYRQRPHCGSGGVRGASDTVSALMRLASPALAPRTGPRGRGRWARGSACLGPRALCRGSRERSRGKHDGNINDNRVGHTTGADTVRVGPRGSPKCPSLHHNMKGPPPLLLPRREYNKIAAKTAIGFAMMGAIGFIVKLIFLPVNRVRAPRDPSIAPAVPVARPPCPSDPCQPAIPLPALLLALRRSSLPSEDSQAFDAGRMIRVLTDSMRPPPHLLHCPPSAPHAVPPAFRVGGGGSACSVVDCRHTGAKGPRAGHGRTHGAPAPSQLARPVQRPPCQCRRWGIPARPAPARAWRPPKVP